MFGMLGNRVVSRESLSVENNNKRPDVITPMHLLDKQVSQIKCLVDCVFS